MSFKKKLFIKALFFVLCLSPSLSFAIEKGLAQTFKELSCVKDVNRYYPSFLDGKLSLDQQDRFFACLRAFLDAVVNKKIVTHTPARDHFTRHEIFKMFHILFQYEEERSRQLTAELLFFKKLLIGGSIDTLKDQELSHLMNLVFDYKEAYYIIHKEIPVFKKLFQGEKIESGGKERVLEQLRKTVLLLSRAYKRENVAYTIEDLSQYPQYISQAMGQKTTEKDLKGKAFFSILQHLFEGALFPQKEIEGEGWPVFVNVIRRSFDLLFYHNQYLLGELSQLQVSYNSLSALEKFLSILASNESLFLERGFPLRNIDGILKASLDFLIPEEDAFLSHLKEERRLRFLTRGFFTLSLSEPSGSKDQVEPAAGGAAPSETPVEREAVRNGGAETALVSFSFPDSHFHFFKDRFTEERQIADYFISAEKIKKIETWIQEYKWGLLDIHKGFEEELAREKGMGNWMDLFFGWEDHQIIYGSFHTSDNRSKMTRLLSYQAFLSLLLTHYAPEAYFDSEEQELSLKQWRLILSDFTPFFAVALGEEGFKPSWQNSLDGLFGLADRFLNSSDLNDSLNRKELLDLLIHFISAVQQSQKVFPKLLSLCGQEPDFSSCSAKSLLSQEEALRPYPRFKDYIFPVKKQEYEQQISNVLSGLEREGSGLQLLELFFLIQIMEVNYYQRINTNLSFNLEFEELLVFADSLKEDVLLNIPYLYNSDQALAFILYSFQSKSLPFFKGTEFEPIRFTHWYLNPKVRSSFSVTPNDFHKLGFEFYNLYKSF